MANVSDSVIDDILGGGKSAPKASTSASVVDELLTGGAFGSEPQESAQGGEQHGPLAKPYSSPIWPVSSDERGNVRFDSDAGILGMAKGAVTHAGNVLQGRVDPMAKESVGPNLDAALLMSPVGAATRIAKPSVLGASKPRVPTAGELRETAEKGYQSARSLGVEYTAPAIRKLADGVERTLNESAIIPNNAPKTFAIIRELQKAPADSVLQFKYAEAVRRELGEIAADPNERRAATIAIKEFDRFLEAPDPTGLVAGTPAAEAAAREASRRYREANANYAASKRSDQITGLGNAAELRAKANNSGQNVGNTIRQRLASLLDKDKQTRGFTEQELAAIERIVAGTRGMNASRYVGNLLGGGGGLGQALTGVGAVSLGGVAGGVPGAIAASSLPVAGAVGKSLHNSLTRKEMRVLDELVRRRSPLFEKLQELAPMEMSDPTRRAALLRSVLGALAQQENPLLVGVGGGSS